MIKISQSITHLANLSAGLSASSAFSELAQPITITGYINTPALRADITHQMAIKPPISQFKPLNIDIGVDEVGRGPLYGSVVVAGVILPNRYSDEIDLSPLKDTKLAALTDSKKLTETKRRQLCPLIKQVALGYIIVEVPAAVIDEMNILQATMTAMRLACEQLLVQIMSVIKQPLAPKFQPMMIGGDTGTDSHPPKATQHWQIRLLIDGNKVPDIDWQMLKAHGVYPETFATEIANTDKPETQAPDSHDNRPSSDSLLNTVSVSVRSEAWIQGDARHTAIAAASVLAKVSRDQQLLLDDAIYKGYGLAQHKGYPTKAHIAAIHALGVLPQHRRSFKPIKQALASLL